jgi:hypothetical protein
MLKKLKIEMLKVEEVEGGVRIDKKSSQDEG